MDDDTLITVCPYAYEVSTASGVGTPNRRPTASVTAQDGGMMFAAR